MKEEAITKIDGVKLILVLRDTLLQVTGSNSIQTITKEIFKKWDASSKPNIETAGGFTFQVVCILLLVLVIQTLH